jgi:hypothetical protein
MVSTYRLQPANPGIPLNLHLPRPIGSRGPFSDPDIVVRVRDHVPALPSSHRTSRVAAVMMTRAARQPDEDEDEEELEHREGIGPLLPLCASVLL